MAFTPLFVYSEYSIFKSTCHMDKLIEKLNNYGYDSCGIADYFAMRGAIKFYKGCTKALIKPLIGINLLISIDGLASSVILYAKNLEGYKSLNQISTYINSSKKAVPLENLKKVADNLICITAGEDSIIYNYLESCDYKSLNNYLRNLKNVFNDFYVGLTHNRDNLDNAYQVIKKMGYNSVALPKIVMIDYEEHEAIKVLNKLEKIEYKLFYGIDNDYLLSKEDIEYYYDSHKDLIDNTTIIKNKCNLTIEFGKTIVPVFDKNIDTASYLYNLGLKGLSIRLKKESSAKEEEYIKRYNYEFNIIKEMGFVDYFLIVFDYVRFAKRNGIYVGSGRGSVGGCLLAYALGISDSDPLKYNLYFERFLNKERISMPDIDIDFQADRREEVIEYVKNKYGENFVAHIASISTFQKDAFNECAKVLNLERNQLEAVKRIIEKTGCDLVSDINNKTTELAELCSYYEEIDKFINVVKIIQGLPSKISTNASSIIISSKELFYYTSLEASSSNILQTVLESSDLEDLGLLKMDTLALSTLTTIDKTIKLIKHDYPDFVVPKSEDEEKVYEMLSKGENYGVFQFESDGMKKLLMELKPTCFSDLVSAIALYRPGPMDNIPTFISCKHGKTKIEYFHPDLKDILEETYGLIIYQEQIMQIARRFAGYSLGEADVLRRAVAKKDHDTLVKEEARFVSSSINKGYDEVTAKKVYNEIVKFADYGFNKAHSVSYAKISYLTAYLKCMYPAYYFSVVLNESIGSKDVESLYKKAISLGVKFVLPSIEKSTASFIAKSDHILMPLSIIDGLSNNSIEQIIVERKKVKFDSFNSFVERTNNFLKSDDYKKLIFSGALDKFGLTKKAMIENLDFVIKSFDFGEIPGLISPEISKEEYSYQELMLKEKEVFGYNLKYDIFMVYNHMYKDPKIKHINELKNNSFINTIGLIKSIKVIKDKNNLDMCFITISDAFSSIEVTIFADVYKTLKNIEINKMVLVNGKTVEKGTIKIIAKFIQII